MPNFNQPEMCREYFRHLEAHSETGKFNDMLETYWLCALLGIAHDETPTDLSDPVGITDHFVGHLKQNQHLVRALLFWKFAESNNYVVDNPEKMTDALNEVFDETNETNLSRIGHEELDRYAAAGFEKLRTNIPNPTDLATFLIDYYDLLENNN